MDRLHKELAEYEASLAALLGALDSDQAPEHLLALSQASAASFAQAMRAMSKCSAQELESLRRWAALAQDTARRARSQVSERIADVGRAQQALSQLDQRRAGESCNIAG